MACASPAPDAHPGVPQFVQAWVRSLLDPEMLDLLRKAESGDRQIEIRFYVSRGRIRRRPTLLLDAGNHEMIDPSEMA